MRASCLISLLVWTFFLFCTGDKVSKEIQLKLFYFLYLYTIYILTQKASVCAQEILSASTSFRRQVSEPECSTNGLNDVEYKTFLPTVFIIHFYLLIVFLYLYSFDRFFGSDKICIFDQSTSKRKIKPGDLLCIGNQYFLALWDSIAFPELSMNAEMLKWLNVEIIYPKFLTKPTLDLFHRMVATYYTTYKSVARLFFPDDIEKLLKFETQGQSKRWKVKSVTPSSFSLYPFSCSQEWQTLIVFPDLWTMFNTLPAERFNDETLKWWNGPLAFLSATQTEKQKDVRRWEVKKWSISVILCTYAEIFQDFHDLKKIIFVDPHKRYYANQQDPRYKVWDVVEEMKRLYGAELAIFWV